MPLHENSGMILPSMQLLTWRLNTEVRRHRQFLHFQENASSSASMMLHCKFLEGEVHV